jgi:hypothetical protein
MKKPTHLALVMALIPTVLLSAGDPMFRTSMSWVPDSDGQQLKLAFEEVDRTDDSSIVEVSGAAKQTPSQMDRSSGFILRGMCGLAKARKQRFFQAKQIDKDPLTYEVRFLATGPASAAIPLDAIAPNVYSVAFCPT